MKAWMQGLIYYKDLRFYTLGSPRYRHLLLLLFWPAFGALFMIMERLLPLLWEAWTGKPLVYYVMEGWLDAQIPFCELFVIPYYFWFVFLIGMLFYGLFFDLQAFRNYMHFVILTYSAAAVIYILFPNMQALRPTELPRDNLLADVVRGLYEFDTNTNVCPSIHVLGAVAVCLSGLHSTRLRSAGWRLFFILSALLICLSTVFLKQHSVIDIYVALALSAVVYPVVFVLPKRRRQAEKEAENAAFV